MWRFALLCSVVTLTFACTDGPGAPTENTDGLFLDAGDPPPPPLDGDGRVTFGDVDASVATDIGTQQVCAFDFFIEGDYFQNKPENNARVHFTPVGGSGAGTIHETANNPDATASGTLVVIGSDGQQHEIHLRDYMGTSLFDYERGTFVGAIGGELVAEVMGCGEITGTIAFTWDCFPECKDGF